MIDAREEILARIFVILTTLADAIRTQDATTTPTVARNRGLMSQDSRPVFILLDGDERTRLDGDRRGRVRMSPSLVTMAPQIFVVMKSRLPQNENLGQEMNELRLIMINALVTDDTLVTLLTANGNINYLGHDTDLKSGSNLEGQMRLDFALTYVLDPYQ